MKIPKLSVIYHAAYWEPGKGHLEAEVLGMICV